MPKPARTPERANTPAAPSSRDVAIKALIRAVALPVLVVVINTARDGWSTSNALLVMGIGVPLLWIALFVADYYIQPAVERRRRTSAARGTTQNRGSQNAPKTANGPRNRNSGSQKAKSPQNKSPQNKSQQGKSQQSKSQGNSPKNKSQRRK